MTRLFGTTLREAPAGCEAVSHALLVRAGFIRQLGQGLYSYLPLARRSLSRIEAILRSEMDALGGQEMTMPVVQPAELWKATGRWQTVGEEMARFKDRRGRDMTLAMTHEETVAELCRTEVRSYRQLPKLVYHIQTKFRDDPRPRAGLIRVREFTMKDSYSLDADEAGLDLQYQAHERAYRSIFQRCGLPVIAVASDTGMMGGSAAHEFMYLTPIGEDTIAQCRSCGAAANRQVARFARAAPAAEAPRPLERVETPHCESIESLAAFLSVEKSRTAKAVLMTGRMAEGTERFIFAVVRGDRELNESKLAAAAGAYELRPATEGEIRSAGAVPGFASPIGLGPNVLVIADVGAAASPNLVAGANQEGYHLLNTNIPRDYQPQIVADIANVEEGDSCERCGAPLSLSRGVEVGNIFKLGTRYTRAVGAVFLNAQGEEKPVVMGSYGIGTGRLLACVAEEHHDERGLRWPIAVSPFDVHLVSLGQPGTPAFQAAERAYQSLGAAGVEVLLDDRAETPGVKFADADLIGVPIRLTASERSLKAGGLELKRRDREEKTVLSEDGLLQRLRGVLGELTPPASPPRE